MRGHCCPWKGHFRRTIEMEVRSQCAEEGRGWEGRKQTQWERVRECSCQSLPIPHSLLPYTTHPRVGSGSVFAIYCTWQSQELSVPWQPWSLGRFTDGLIQSQCKQVENTNRFTWIPQEAQPEANVYVLPVDWGVWFQAAGVGDQGREAGKER